MIKNNESDIVNRKRVAVIGAGLVGSLIAIILSKRGFSVDLYEKRIDVRKVNISQNRTIAMSISYRGNKALKSIGLNDFIKYKTIPKHSRMVYKTDGTRISQRYGKNNDTINTINRQELNSILLDEFEKKQNSKVYFEHSLVEYYHQNNEVLFYDLKSSNNIRKKYEWIIGTDGVFSKLRESLVERKLISVEHTIVEYGYRELEIPANENGYYKLKKDHVHVWPRGKSVLVALPTQHGKFTCNIFLPASGEYSLESINTIEKLNSFFNMDYPQFKKLNPDYGDSYFQNSSSNIYALKCNNWNYKNKVLLLGDAAHAIVPFLAMGMNVGFEDCSIFEDLLNRYNNNLSQVIEKFTMVRKPDTDEIADLSYKNFMDLISSVNKPYDYIWKLNRILWDYFPETWIPLYPMIAFSNIPFTEVVKRYKLQDNIISDIISNGNTKNINLDNLVSKNNLRKLVTNKLQEFTEFQTDRII